MLPLIARCRSEDLRPSVSYCFLSFSFLDCVLGSPPIGCASACRPNTAEVATPPRRAASRARVSPAPMRDWRAHSPRSFS
jgi:hypothetical protein